MYADRYAKPAGIKPGSLIVAIAINAGVIGALMFSAPVIDAIAERSALTITNIPVDPPPPEPILPEAKASAEAQAAKPQEQVMTSTALISDADASFVLPPPLPLPPLPLLPPLPGGAVAPVTRADPVLVEARVDPRYARDLQPAYPAGERRAEREGIATVRVTIGADGRVTAAECVSATSDDFCRATRQQALSKWRFQPATRDGVPVEATKVMTVRFELES